ncbi:helix-turn-helix domain-containing protein [Streptacidiphilus anmyonensis]|uniref:helix-turn-helix domain-containing protein n=1 Tax=Streptacidiphilus anmyonensis TaxID=405782 RepID=UPI000A77C611|nr:helix-turn-helix domain-containing protein [Streptacidiphilus anmyonensis]
MSSYVPSPPSERPIELSRQMLGVLALLDMSRTARRVLDMLLSLADPEDGTAEVSQDEMCVLLGVSKPGVNRGFKELRECGLTWQLQRGLYQLHPALTGTVAGPVASVPEIRPADPEAFSEQRRERFAAQVANLTKRSA